MDMTNKNTNIDAVLAKYGIASLEEAKNLCLENGIDVEKIVKGIQPICFDNAVKAYEIGVAIALKTGTEKASEVALCLGEGLQAYCVKGSVADERQIGLGHGRLGSMLLNEETKSFCFLAGHESFAAAEGAIGIVTSANRVRKSPLNVILNGLGKDAAYIISRINGFTYVETNYDHKTGELKIVSQKAFSNGDRAKVKCYGSYDVPEGVAIMRHEKVDVSITGNSTNPVRFQHPVAGIYKKWCFENGKTYLDRKSVV